VSGNWSLKEGELSEAVADQSNPFEDFNKAMGAGVVQNPYPEFASMREQHIVPADVRMLLGLDADADLGFEPGDVPPLYTVSSYDAVQEVLRDNLRFSSTGYAEVMGAVMGHTILEMDEPEHHAYRSVIQQAFSRKAMEMWESELVGGVVDELIDTFVDDKRADLVSQLLFPFPVNVIAGLLGLPRADLPQFHRWTVELISVSIDMDKALNASKSLYDYLVEFVHLRREAPGNDMISVLAHSEHEGQKLTDDEIIAFCRLLLPAGAETTYRSSSNLMTGLLTHPDQLDAVRNDRSLLPHAIEEGLRWEPPLLTIMRTATQDTTVCGVNIEAGSVMVVNMGAANHDERRWDDAESFNIFRPQSAHIAFASGPHMCLGMHLARMETKVAINRIFDRLRNVRLDPDAESPYITGMTFRSPPRLDVVFD
jgi:cytochrome P450